MVGIKFGMDLILAIFFVMKTLLNKSLARGQFPIETCIDRVSLWELHGPWYDGVAEHEGYIYTTKFVWD